MSNTTTMFDYKGEIFSGRELLAIEIGREIEQERIIKLLNELSEELYCTQKLQNAGLNMRCNHYWQEIALIRGEGKL